MERDAVVDLDELYPELDRIRLEDGHHVDAGGLAGDIDQDATARVLQRQGDRIDDAVGQRHLRPLRQRMARRHQGDQRFAHLEHRREVAFDARIEGQTDIGAAFTHGRDDVVVRSTVTSKVMPGWRALNRMIAWGSTPGTRDSIDWILIVPRRNPFSASSSERTRSVWRRLERA